MAALTRLYAFLYGEPEDAVRPAAVYRTEAMDVSDQWVAEGCHRDSPLLALEHAALVRSYAACWPRCTTKHSGRVPGAPLRPGY